MKFNVVVVGSTGLVGQRLVSMLSKHQWFNLIGITASKDKANKKYKDVVKWSLENKMPENVEEMIVYDTNIENINNLKPDIVFTSLPTDISKDFDIQLVKQGYVVISHASNNRMDKDVPLLNPEVNADHINVLKLQANRWKGRLIKVPNCATSILTLALKPIYDNFGLRHVFVSTMQALSGAGINGVSSMAILDNIIPYIEHEEEKIENESLKILGELSNESIKPNESFYVSASVHRVNVLEGHLESVFLKTDNDVSVEEIKKSLIEFKENKIKNLNLPTKPSQPIIVRNEIDRPQPRLDRNEGNGMSIVVGRIRKDNRNWIKFNVLGHNTIRGAAGNGVLIGELVAKNYNDIIQ
ncbi:aspartate-semialdehyde dehydrogenase [Caldisphaera lagunensis DSM 15908]|uniref:Aspartate-semialdehyde dehydrogenase n=1 Tax=Caldisphaera lagunensis (strain DSM 15908 / JCM 11604 / ANMR 0165 / IC-154) TaxID=1056495 RepID=L0A7U9_CALLD|nr:aspartate-semialdehyde dehydrogenase [Caldisphaera lagunensis]AFZ69906.1 aspartate-semialdehyde dehydrogenase [Caldisphaera lagunensis DSM 15908]